MSGLINAIHKGGEFGDILTNLLCTHMILFAAQKRATFTQDKVVSNINHPSLQTTSISELLSQARKDAR
ncbi:TPA: hypothetical protein ACTYZW_004695, partial [Citrobacter freundii]